MSRKRQIRFRSWLALGTALAIMLAFAGGAWAAFTGLPLNGQQVNDDPPTIDPTQNVNVSDLTAGSLVGGARVPWAAFAQAQSGSPADHRRARVQKRRLAHAGFPRVAEP